MPKLSNIERSFDEIKKKARVSTPNPWLDRGFNRIDPWGKEPGIRIDDIPERLGLVQEGQQSPAVLMGGLFVDLGDTPANYGERAQFVQTDGSGKLSWGWPYWEKSGTSIFYKKGSVAIGLSSPLARFHTYGDNILDGAVTINESGRDKDFRVESLTYTHMLFVDAGNDRVGIMEDAPSYPFDVNGAGRFDDLYLNDTNASHVALIHWNEDEASANRILNFTLSGGDRTFALHGNLTVEATSLVNQDLTTDARVAFAGIDSSSYIKLSNNNELRFYDNGNYVGFEAPALDANQIWVLPDADADAANKCLMSDSAGNLGWSQALGVGDNPTFLGAVLGGDTNYATFDADGKLALTGTARVTKQIILSTSFLERGLTAPDVAYNGNYLSWSYNIGDDSVMTYLVPNDWASGTDIIVKVHWFIDEAYTSDKEVKWQCLWSLCPHGNSEPVDAPTHSGTLTGSSINIPATAKYLVETTVGTIPGASITVEDELGLVLSRLAADNDDPTADPQVVHLELVYTANKLGAAIS